MNNINYILYKSKIPLSIQYYNIIDNYYTTNCIGNIARNIGYEYIPLMTRTINVIYDFTKNNIDIK